MSDPTAYGGQAVIEGVVIRGRRTIALACRRPNGEIYRYREAIDSPLQRSRLVKLPFVRGVVVLWESLSYGMRMLMRSADIQLEEPQGGGENEKLGTAGSSALMLVGVVAALLIFIGLPYLLTQLLHAFIGSSLVLNIAEGIVRLGLFVGYLFAISFMPDIRRVFAYHGAEHMTIHAFENGEPLDTAHIEPYPTAHPRCGTAFLLFVVVIAIILFAFIPRANLIVDLASRLLLVVPVAAIAYEVLKLGARHERNPFMRLAVAPGLLLQAITTRRPDRAMIEVAVASLEEALAGDAAAPAA
ncbi:MAG TPA: DUF1385 domain-containing protein [Candidatus Limnocylindria bacterium]|jgi:uncharacterized protein YqhQ